MTLDAIGDDDDMGFGLSDLARVARSALPGRGRRRRAAPVAVRRSSAPMPGRGMPAPLSVARGGVAPMAGLYPVSLPPFVFTAAVGVNQIRQTLNPQVNFRAQRMIVTPLRTGASAALAIPLLYTGFVGIKAINISGIPLAAEIFTATGVDMNLTFPPTRPGIEYSMSLGLSAALAGADTFIVYVTFLGTAYQ